MGVCYGTPDFPTPSFTGYLKSGMKLTITDSSSSDSKSHDLVAAHGHQASRERKILAESSLTVFTVAELKEATKNFGGDALVGEEGFGCVYKGMLHGKQQSGRTKTIITVKKLNPDGTQGYREWLTEIQFLGRISHPNLAKLLGFCQEDETLALVYEFIPKGSLNNHLFRSKWPSLVILDVSEVNFLGSLSHPNIVRLLGYCLEDKELLLVYEYMPKGTLKNHLFGRGSAIKPLPWVLRLKIAIEAARGLAFLHQLERQIICRDFKPSNILLDSSYNAKISDFGLARKGPDEDRSHVSTRVIGTYGYAAPEYIATGHLYVKSDVYSFGVVLVELLTGMRAYDANRPTDQQILVEWVKPHLSKRKLTRIMDSRLEGRYPLKDALDVAALAFQCLQYSPKHRPSMHEVVQTLERISSS
ncbi:probable serine/threonine-protein kinase PIX13 isoform X1 [Rhodamnia argentea]|uniref:Probable serine/threonine-protein kinase PIX13 isoform X1 n=1 Tax=Rhodamnia argentea TaxID=178133 RepID=A0ABM3GWV1_9MYRT|nr:probable serine/threonine-protein kinase PIX13 isoform X1 [Rhodamnia argentea]